jgi:hypothetical protein
MDDLHGAWLPQEIFTDISIVDPDPTVATESEETAATMEEITVQFVDIIGASHGKSPPHTPPPPPPSTPAPASTTVPAPHHLIAPVSDRSLLRRFHFGLVWFGFVLCGCLDSDR